MTHPSILAAANAVFVLNALISFLDAAAFLAMSWTGMNLFWVSPCAALISVVGPDFGVELEFQLQLELLLVLRLQWT